MKTRHGSQASTRITLKAVYAAASLCACATAWADGGTIRFVGALVAPTFDIAMGHGASIASATMEGRQRYDAVTGVTTVAYRSEPSVAPRATVSVLPASGVAAQGAPAPRQRVEVEFVDGGGRRVSPDAAGRYRIGASGGVLTLAPTSLANTAGASYAIVLTDYR